ncbi:MAG: hypothetical protein R3B93_19135 [Bacteroidia bacterium]
MKALILILTIGIISFSKPITAQTPQEILIKMASSMSELKDVNIKVSGMVHAVESDGTSQSSFSAEVIKAGSNYYSTFMGTEMVINDTIMLTIDNESRILVADPFDPEIWNRSDLLQQNPQKMAEEFKVWADKSKAELTKTPKGYLMTIKDPGALINLTKVLIHKKTFLPIQFEFVYNTKLKSTISKVVADYTFKPIKENHQSSKFDIEDYLKNDSGKIIPVSKYASYEWINRLH